MTDAHLTPSNEAAIALIQRGHAGPVVMLNLLRFREMADYSAMPTLAPATPITGQAAFDLYIASARPHLEASGGSILFQAAGGPWFIGPAGESWDLVMLVRQTSVEAFLGWAEHEAYLDGIGHRTAALEDSRLLPLFGAEGPHRE